jgi:hypothetical protein
MASIALIGCGGGGGGGAGICVTIVCQHPSDLRCLGNCTVTQVYRMNSVNIL